jgi:hypothetical protein
MPIEYSKTLGAYQGYTGGMNHITRTAHDLVLGEDCLGNESWVKRLLKGVNKIAASNEELLLQTWIGKLRYKLPSFHVKDKFQPHDYEVLKLAMCGVILNVLLDNGTYDIREEVKRLDMPDGSKKFKKFLYIILGGDPVRDMLKGIHLVPGVVTQHAVHNWQLSGDQRALLADIASVPLKIWDGCTKELLIHGYSMKTDWDTKVDRFGNKLKEDPILKKRRCSVYADKIMDQIKPLPRFYLSAKFDHRFRTYYDAATLEGIRPNGKLWETLMFVAADPFDLTEKDERVLKHIIFNNLYKMKVSMEKACWNFKQRHLDKAKGINPLETTNQDDFGVALLLNRAAEALEQYYAGEQSTFIFGYDFTNSGLMMSGLSFHSKEMMKASNLGGYQTVYDSHTEFGKGFGLDLKRDTVKELHIPLLHGSTNKTLTRILNEHVEVPITESQVVQAIEKSYGPCVRNIATIADWGTLVFGNRQSVLRWTLPDGYRASSRAELRGVPVRIYACSSRFKEGYNSYVVLADMPLLEDKNGISIYDKDTMLDGVHYKVGVHKRGLFADITHSIDAYILRCVVAALKAAGRPFMLKHDDYIVPPGARQLVMSAAQEAFSVLYGENVYKKAMAEIAEHSPYHPLVPTLYDGKAKNTAVVSNTFLMP